MLFCQEYDVKAFIEYEDKLTLNPLKLYIYGRWAMCYFSALSNGILVQLNSLASKPPFILNIIECCSKYNLMDMKIETGEILCIKERLC